MADNIDIISIGECMVELSSTVGLAYAESLNKYYGGDTISTAVAAARLGSTVGYLTKVGNDLFRDFFLDSWQAENIDISHVGMGEGYNGLFFISRQDSGEKEILFYRKKSAPTTLSVNDINEEYIKKASIVYSTGLTQSLSESVRESVKKAFSIAKKEETTVAYDPNYRPRLWNIDEAKEALEEIIEYVDIILLNATHDAEKLYGISSPDKIIKSFWDKGVPIVGVKMGAQGSAIGYNGEINYIPACVSNVYDTTGAGDAYNGGFLHGIAEGYTPFEASKLASIVAGFQIQGLGMVKPIPYKDKVYAEFKHGDN